MKQLPVFSNVFKAMVFTFNNLALLLTSAAPWLGLYALFTMLFQLLGIDEYYRLQNAVSYVTDYPILSQKNGYESLTQLTFQYEAMSSQLGSLVGLHYFGSKLILAVAYSAVAVIWYRVYLLAEQAPKMRFGSLEFKFLTYLVGFLAVYLGLLFLGTYIFLDTSISSGSLGFGVIIGGFFLLVWVVRYIMIFAGVSVGDRRMTLRVSWKITKGNSWRIYGGALLLMLVSVPIFIFKAIISGVNFPIFIDWPIQALLSMVVVALLLSFTSICYQYFMPKPSAGDLN